MQINNACIEKCENVIKEKLQYFEKNIDKKIIQIENLNKKLKLKTFQIKIYKIAYLKK